MTDYFAVLDEPRHPWLDPQQLKEKFHSLSLQLHPDVQSGFAASSPSFGAINEAYRVLQDSKLRLKHLLALEGQDASASAEIPPELADLFWQTGSLLRELDALIAETAHVTNILGRALLKTKTLDAQKRAQEWTAEVRRLYDATIEELRLRGDWKDQLPALNRSYRLLSYTGRWIEQLEERLLALG